MLVLLHPDIVNIWMLRSGFNIFFFSMRTWTGNFKANLVGLVCMCVLSLVCVRARDPSSLFVRARVPSSVCVLTLVPSLERVACT